MSVIFLFFFAVGWVATLANWFDTTRPPIPSAQRWKKLRWLLIIGYAVTLLFIRGMLFRRYDDTSVTIHPQDTGMVVSCQFQLDRWTMENMQEQDDPVATACYWTCYVLAYPIIGIETACHTKRYSGHDPQWLRISGLIRDQVHGPYDHLSIELGDSAEITVFRTPDGMPDHGN